MRDSARAARSDPEMSIPGVLPPGSDGGKTPAPDAPAPGSGRRRCGAVDEGRPGDFFTNQRRGVPYHGCPVHRAEMGEDHLQFMPSPLKADVTSQSSGSSPPVRAASLMSREFQQDARRICSGIRCRTARRSIWRSRFLAVPLPSAGHASWRGVAQPFTNRNAKPMRPIGYWELAVVQPDISKDKMPLGRFRWPYSRLQGSEPSYPFIWLPHTFAAMWCSARPERAVPRAFRQACGPGGAASTQYTNGAPSTQFARQRSGHELNPSGNSGTKLGICVRRRARLLLNRRWPVARSTRRANGVGGQGCSRCAPAAHRAASRHGGGPGSTATTTLKITTDPHSSHG